MKIKIPYLISTSSAASEKAKTLGLKHIGFGKYLSEKGDKYMTVDGKLYATKDYKIPLKSVDEEIEEDELYEDIDEDIDGELDEDIDEDIDGELDEDIDEDIDGELDEDIDGEIAPEPIPDNQKELFDINKIPEHMIRRQTKDSEERMQQRMLENSQETAKVGDKTVKLKRTSELVSDIKSYFGKTTNQYREAFKELADDIKNRQGPKDDESDWELDDDGNPVDPNSERKKAERKKIIVGVGTVVLGAVGLVMLGSFAGLAVGLVASHLADDYIDSINKSVGLEEEKKQEQQVQRNYGDGRVVRKSFYDENKEDKYEYVEDKDGKLTRRLKPLRGTSRPNAMRNYGYKPGGNVLDPFAEQRYETVVSSGASVDDDLFIIISDYKSWLKTINLKEVFDEVVENEDYD